MQRRGAKSLLIKKIIKNLQGKEIHSTFAPDFDGRTKPFGETERGVAQSG